MNKVRRIVIGIISSICLILIFAFVRSLGSTYIETSHVSYEISGMTNGVNADKFNRVIQNYTQSHNISAIKVFNVPMVDGGNTTNTKMYVYGKHLSLPTGTVATKSQLLTSDIRYPLYFIGKTNQASIEKMFARNGIHYTHINESWNWNIWNFLNTNQIFSLLVLAFLVMGIVLILANLTDLKKANIRRLLGMSNFDDACDSFLDDQAAFLSIYLVGLTIIAGYMWFAHYTRIYRIMLYFAGFLYLLALIVSLIAAIIRAKSHSEKTITAAIKGNSKSKLSFYINMVIKVVVEVFACTAFVALLGTIQQERQLNHQLSSWTQGKNYYTMNLAPLTGTESTESNQENHNTALFFKYLENHHGMLVNYGGWDAGKSDVMDMFNGNVLTVNAEYLKVNQVVASNGHQLSVPAKSKTTYVLIPASDYANRRAILKNYRDYLYLNNAQAKTGQSLPIKAIKIKNHQQFFTYSADALDMGYYDGYAQDPVIVVLSSESLGGTSKRNVDANSVWTTYLSNQAFLSPNVATIKHGLNKTHLTRTIGGIVNTKSRALKELSKIQNSLHLSVTVILISLLIIMIENIAFNHIYFNNNRKKIAIRRLLGTRFTTIYGPFLALTFALSVLEAVIVWLITKNTVIVTALLITSNIGEGLLLVIQNNSLNKHVAKTIKGE
ncbi:MULTISPECIES: DUF1430 domain-containing protein [Lactiplantibacillus]|uniref:DUF1430 domain-containing protein n=1 Tax=Lactiplantibacillus pentosus TaxID=1589 RepID=A0ABD7IRN7_LACPE|nr:MULTISPECIES: DUF1430 domain-containing protein [Lactiplantibacillus]MCM8607275.1 DUF1430 domain-containing protein [Lactiplantibacillus sp. B652]PRO96116.1 hypothetical protein C6Y08_01095 [Lactiplantibacillus pentosus]RMW49779.1 DUF1430 domain-containing protein [Lactiplantibacillus pentosus]